MDNLYIMVESFPSLAFTNWTKIINIENDEIFLNFDGKGMLCITVRGNMVPFYYNDKILRSTKQ